MNYKKLLSLILFCMIFFTSCEEKHTSKEVEAIFTTSEIADLNVLLNHFESTIQIEGKSREASYKHWLESPHTHNKVMTEAEKKAFKKQLEAYAKIDNSTFNEIWTFTKNFQFKPKIDTLKTIAINQDGKYISYLKILAENNPNYKQYLEKIYATGMLNGGLHLKNIALQYHPKKDVEKGFDIIYIADLNNYNTRLTLAIHALHVNDDILRREKWVD